MQLNDLSSIYQAINDDTNALTDQKLENHKLNFLKSLKN